MLFPTAHGATEIIFLLLPLFVVINFHFGVLIGIWWAGEWFVHVQKFTTKQKIHICRDAMHIYIHTDTHLFHSGDDTLSTISTNGKQFSAFPTTIYFFFSYYFFFCYF